MTIETLPRLQAIASAIHTLSLNEDSKDKVLSLIEEAFIAGQYYRLVRTGVYQRSNTGHINSTDNKSQYIDIASEVIEELCQYYQVELHEILSDSRALKIAQCRKALAYHLYYGTSFGTQDVGRILNIDHSTVIYHCKTYLENIMPPKHKPDTKTQPIQDHERLHESCKSLKKLNLDRFLRKRFL
jgi:hypothetical protein